MTAKGRIERAKGRPRGCGGHDVRVWRSCGGFTERDGGESRVHLAGFPTVIDVDADGLCGTVPSESGDFTHLTTAGISLILLT